MLKVLFWLKDLFVKLFRRFIFEIQNKYVMLDLCRLDVQMGRGCVFVGIPIIDLSRGGRIIFYDRVKFISKSLNNALGLNHQIVIRCLSQNAFIEIGSDTGLSGVSICAQKKVKIGSVCLIGANVIIADTDFHPVKPEGRRYAPLPDNPKAVVIGDNVFLGANSIILKGVVIGENTVIGAGSVVVDDVPPNCVAVGNPAKVVRLNNFN
jgi:acetyltransferase-like isoleucine patch superfamily enzyme